MKLLIYTTNIIYIIFTDTITYMYMYVHVSDYIKHLQPDIT